MPHPAGSRKPATSPPDTNPAPKATAEIIRSLRLYCEAIEPRAANDADILLNLSWIRSTSPYPELRDGPKAVAFAKQVIELIGDRNPGILSNLAAAHAEAGDFENAIATQQKPSPSSAKAANPKPPTPPPSNSTNPTNPSAMTRGNPPNVAGTCCSSPSGGNLSPDSSKTHYFP